MLARCSNGILCRFRASDLRKEKGGEEENEEEEEEEEEEDRRIFVFDRRFDLTSIIPSHPQPIFTVSPSQTTVRQTSSAYLRVFWLQGNEVA